MNRTMAKECIIAASLTVSIVGSCWAQHVDKGKPILEIYTGRANFQESCASCHGADGKGNGPVSSQLKVPPTDLTVLAKKNKGVFPVASVYEVIDGRKAVLAHGPREMPIWGFRYQPSEIQKYIQGPDNSSFDPEAVVRARILSIVDYLNQIQEK